MKIAATVLVDTYNHERFIEEAVVSVLEQVFPARDMEILVVDDGSSDRTPDIVRKFAPRVRLLQKANGGQASAFNAGIAEARGEIVAFLDGDDWWARNKLERVAEAMAADPEVGVVGHGIIIVHRDGRRQVEILREGFRFRANTIEGAKLFRRRKSQVGTSRMTIRRELLRQIGTVPEAIRIQADEYIFTLAAALAGAKILPDALTYYRMHGGNRFQISTNNGTTLRNKQEALAELARELSRSLTERGISSDTTKTITEVIVAEADQARLLADGGWPWELVRAEMKIYDVVYEDVSRLRRALKIAGLLPSLFMPPRTYYKMRRFLDQCGVYNRFLRRWLPFSHAAHVGQSPRGG